MEATMSEYAPLGWTVDAWIKMRARMADGITDDRDDVRLPDKWVRFDGDIMRKAVDPDDEEDDDRMDVHPDDEEDDDRKAEKKKAKADDDEDDADEAEERDRINDMYVMRGYSVRRRFDGGDAGLRRVALHEAGHCVVAIAQGRRINFATVVAGRDYAGKMSEEETPEMMTELLDLLSGGRATAEVEACARKHVVGYMAGMVTEWLMCPRESWQSNRHHTAGSDLKLAKLFAKAICRSEEEAEALLTSARAEARQILLARRRLVEAIADALMARGTMTGDELDEICKSPVSA
jgi:hypothetical protein